MLSKLAKHLSFASCLFGVAGVICNRLVMYVNGGYMPIIGGGCVDAPGEVVDSRHICYSADTHLAFLADRFHFGHYFYAIGDLLFPPSEWLAYATVALLGVIALSRAGRHLAKIPT